MNRLRAWLPGAAQPANDTITAFDEVEALQDAMTATEMILNDEYAEAEAALSKGDSPFHKFGKGSVYFLRAMLGIEKDILRRGVPLLADAEKTSWECYTRALHDPTFGHQSSIYPAGSEYALIHAESQMMFVVMSIMNGSLSEGLKGLYKLRKVYSTLHEIVEAETKSLAALAAEASNDQKLDQSSKDAKQNLPGDDNASTHDRAADSQSDFRAVTSDPVDLFIHAGVSLTFGWLHLVLSRIPPPYDRFLSMISLRGDRDMGHKLLIESTKFMKSFHGALGTFSILVIYNGPLAICKIKRKMALSHEDLKTLLHDLRQLYPKSQLWRLQEVAMLGQAQQLGEARDILRSGAESALPFIKALFVFEQGLHSLYAHDYDASAAAILELRDINDWGPGLFYYIAGVAYADAYRVALASSASEKEAQEYADKANDCLCKVPAELGKKKILGRAIPIEAYIKRKMAKYTARAVAQECTIVNALGVSPAEEIIYIWGGHDRMPPEQLRTSLERISWTNSQDQTTETADEKALRSVLKASCLRSLGQLEDAKSELQQGGALTLTQVDTKTWSRDADHWILPVAHYEMAACLWVETGGEQGDKAVWKECAQEIHRSKGWGSHDLESAMGIKVTTAVETLRKLKVYD